jgi:hypothetical protein
MVLHIHSDASYMSASEAHSRAGCHFFLGAHPTKAIKQNNIPILVMSAILKHVMSSAAEAQLGSTFINTKEGIPTHVVFEELGHAHPTTPLQTNNSTACGIITDTVNHKRSKAIDVHFYWVKDIVHQCQYNIYWAPGVKTWVITIYSITPTRTYVSYRPPC